MVTVTSSRVFPRPFEVNQDVTFLGGGTLPGGGGTGVRPRRGAPPLPRPGPRPGLTHVPGAYEDGDHVGLVLLGVLVLHELQQLAEGLPLLEDGGQSGAGGSQEPPSPGTPCSVAAPTSRGMCPVLEHTTGAQEVFPE